MGGGIVVSKIILLSGARTGSHYICKLFNDTVKSKFYPELMNKSHWLNKNKTKPIIACSECITFKDDEWAVTNAGTSSNCVDLWNETGVQFDTTVKAYNAPVAETSYELTTNSWHAVCPGTGLVAQYLGGVSGTNTAPFWSTPTTGCGG